MRFPTLENLTDPGMLGKLWVVSFTCSLCTAVVVVLGLPDDADETVVSGVSGTRHPALTGAVKFMTAAGNIPVVVPLTALMLVYFFHRKRYDLALVLAALAGGGHLLTEGVKAIVTRTRPEDYWAVREPGYSFPSGHMLIGLCFYFGGAYILTLVPENRERLRRLPLLGLSFAVLLGLTRLYLGVHYPSDIVGGAALGACWMASVALLYKLVSSKLEKQKTNGKLEK